MEEVLLELGELAGAEQGVGVDDERRQHLRVAVLAGVEVEHEVDQRPLEQGPGPEVDREAGAGELGAAFEIQDAERRPEVPVGLGWKVEGARGAHRALAAVGGLVLAHRDAVVRQVGQGVLDGQQLGLDRLEAPFDLLDAPLELAHGGDLGRGVAAALLDLADGPAGLVALALEVLDLDQGRAPFGVEHLPGVELRRAAVAVEQALADLLGIVA